jgi:hypothetical protein
MIIERRIMRTNPNEIVPLWSSNKEEIKIKKTKPTLPIISKMAIEIYLPIKNPPVVINNILHQLV